MQFLMNQNLHCSSCSSSSYCSSGSLVGEAEGGALGSTGFSPSALCKQMQTGNFQLQAWAINCVKKNWLNKCVYWTKIAGFGKKF